MWRNALDFPQYQSITYISFVNKMNDMPEKSMRWTIWKGNIVNHIKGDLSSFSYIYQSRKHFWIISVQFSRSVLSNSLQPHGLKHARPPCPSPTPEVHSNSSPLSWWCHPTISSSVVPFSSHLQSFPASGSFRMSQLLQSGGQSTGISASTSVLPMNIQDWIPLGWTSWISLLANGLSLVFSNTTVQKHQFFGAHFSL